MNIVQPVFHLYQTIIFAIVQGVTELFPISSVGHAVILPFLLHWPNISAAPTFVPYLVMLHLGTAIALILYFLKDWIVFVRAIFATGEEAKTERTQVARKEFWLLVIGTVPAVVFGEFLNKPLTQLFAKPVATTVFLIINGIVLILGDRLLRRRGNRDLKDMTVEQIVGVGILESFALIPGFSRSGMSMIGGLLFGLRYEAAARLSFLLATPVIVGAAVKELPKLHGSGSILVQGAIGGVLAGIFAYLSTWFLMRYFRRHEVRALRPFGIYCIVVGLGVLIYALVY